MQTLPINLNAERMRCLVVGGGTVALQKARVLTAAGIGVRVVAPFVLRELELLPGVVIERRAFREEDLGTAQLAIAASDDPELNHRVYELGHRRGLLVNCVDDPAWCDFIFPSILRRGELTLGVSTGGGSPSLARLLREWLELELDRDFGETLAFLEEMRRRTRGLPCPGARRALNECLARMALKARRGAIADLRRRMEEILAPFAPIPADRPDGSNGEREPGPSASGPDAAAPGNAGGGRRAGRVTLVGAGPGDPELITLAGLRALAEADMVIYDRLVNPELLKHAPRAARIYAGKQPGEAHEAAQERINSLMLREARAGGHVVRLKGGDPFIFGRGGEEALAARREGLEVRVVPGVTAALGAAAACELPLTHRHLAASVAFVTGCSAADGRRPHVEWRAMAQAVDTLVLYMGVRPLARIAAELIAGGRPADEPVAAIEQATTPLQKVRHFTLEELSRGAADAAVTAPAVFVIGEVVRVGRELEALARQALLQA